MGIVSALSSHDRQLLLISKVIRALKSVNDSDLRGEVLDLNAGRGWLGLSYYGQRSRVKGAVKRKGDKVSVGDKKFAIRESAAIINHHLLALGISLGEGCLLKLAERALSGTIGFNEVGEIVDAFNNPEVEASQSDDTEKLDADDYIVVDSSGAIDLDGVRRQLIEVDGDRIKIEIINGKQYISLAE